MFDTSKFVYLEDVLNVLMADAERLSGLKRNGAELPFIHNGADDPVAALYLSHYGAGGAYIDQSNEINGGSLLYDTRLASEFGDTKFASILVHEIVHYLQDVNGLLKPARNNADQAATELLAYQTQAAWLRENGITEPDKVFPEAFEPGFLNERYGAGFYATALAPSHAEPDHA